MGLLRAVGGGRRQAVNREKEAAAVELVTGGALARVGCWRRDGKLWWEVGSQFRGSDRADDGRSGERGGELVGGGCNGVGGAPWSHACRAWPLGGAWLWRHVGQPALLGSHGRCAG
jgi:hypothetical protein